MATFKSEFMRVMDERQYIHQCSAPEQLDALASSKRMTGYIGYDATASSLHVGNLVTIMMLRKMQQTGHRPIVLVGGGTTKVGDPSGKTELRQILSEEEIATNIAGIKKVYSRFLDFGDGPTDAILVNNADWLDGIEYIPFLRDFGSHFSVNRLLSFESVRARLDREQTLSFLEFNYMLLQAYDFVELGRRFDCELQMGGSDQWGNIISGVDLGRRVDAREFFALTTALIMNSAGEKMGKSVSGAIWIDPDLMSPYEYWQYWRNTDDRDVGRFLRLYTEMPIDEIIRLESLRDEEINDAKKILATEATALAHGKETAVTAAETSRQTFEEGSSGDDLPKTQVSRSRLAEGVSVVELFRLAELCKSNGEVRRLIKGGGARLNDQVVEDENLSVTADGDAPIKLSAGRKRHALIVPS